MSRKARDSTERMHNYLTSTDGSPLFRTLNGDYLSVSYFDAIKLSLSLLYSLLQDWLGSEPSRVSYHLSNQHAT